MTLQIGQSSKRSMEVSLPEQQLLYRLRQLVNQSEKSQIVVWIQGRAITHISKIEELAAPENSSPLDT